MFSFGTVTVQNEKRRERDPPGKYPMSSPPHGVAVVINNGKKGVDIDKQNLVQVLHFLGYSVEVYRNCSANEIKEIMEEYGKRNHSNHDSFVCCILSHKKKGQKGHVFGSDGTLIRIEDITKSLNGKDCKLAGKPKIFFLQGLLNII